MNRLNHRWLSGRLFLFVTNRGVRDCADSRLSRLVHRGEEDEVLLDHAPRELRDIGLVEIIGGLIPVPADADSRGDSRIG